MLVRCLRRPYGSTGGGGCSMYLIHVLIAFVLCSCLQNAQWSESIMRTYFFYNLSGVSYEAVLGPRQ